MKYEVDGHVFDAEEEAIQFCAEEEIPTAKIVVVEEAIEEDTEETDEELTELLEAVEDYEHLPKEDRDYVLNEVLPSKKKLRKVIENLDKITSISSSPQIKILVEGSRKLILELLKER